MHAPKDLSQKTWLDRPARRSSIVCVVTNPRRSSASSATEDCATLARLMHTSERSMRPVDWPNRIRPIAVILKSAAALFVGVAAPACVAPALSASGATVQLTKGEPAGCQELGDVSATGGGGNFTSADHKLTVARNQLREKTAAMGGNVVVMDVVTASWGETTIGGRAFRCSSEGPAPAAEAPAQAPAKSVEERLQELKRLHEAQLITDEEYEQRKATILKEV